MHYLILSFTVLLNLFAVNAQCSDCSSLEEAVKAPEKVIKLDLSNKGLLEIPSEIAKMKNLQELDLSDNPLTSFRLSAPLPMVRKLNLHKTIPDPNNLPELKTLFPNLEVLDLSDCYLATLPTNMFAFNRLHTLDLSSNGLTFLPDDLIRLNQLQFLDLSDNQLKETGSVLGSLWKLIELNITQNPKLEMLGLLNSLKANNSLQSLAISDLPMRKESDQLLASLPIRKVTIDGLNETLPKGILKNPNIVEVTIKHANNSAELAAGLTSMSQVTTLVMDHSAIPTDLERVKQLQKLVLIGTETANISAIRKWGFLKDLDLVKTHFDAAVLEEIKQILPKTNIVTSYQTIEPEMAANTLKPMVQIPVIEQKVDASTPQIINVENVIFDIPSQGFLLPDGSVYSGEVRFQVKVFNNAIDIALEGAPMTFRDSSGRMDIFSSDGMMDVRAKTPDGVELSVNPNAPINVTMPDLQTGQTSDLFTFNEQTNQWQRVPVAPRPANNDSLIRAITDSLNKVDLSSYVPFRNADRLFAIDFKKKNVDASRLCITTYRPRKLKELRQETMTISRNLNEGRLIAKEVWHIDTIMTPALRKLLHSVDASYSLTESRIESSKFLFTSEPRLLYNLQINPDFTRDHYRMTFNYRDTSYNLPVYLDGKSSKQSLKRHKRFQKELEEQRKKDKLEEAQIARLKDVITDTYVKTNREQMIRNLVNQEVFNRTNPGAGFTDTRFDYKLSFPLPAFGLINCDFFQRTIPINTFSLAENLTDQDSITYKTPLAVRIAYPAYVSYLQSNSKNIPLVDIGLTIVLLELAPNILGAISLDRESKSIPSGVRTMNTDGKSSLDIQQFIQSIK